VVQIHENCCNGDEGDEGDEQAGGRELLAEVRIQNS
jgi:hypothetical protein